MRVLVHGESAVRAERLREALLGIEARGHRVGWVSERHGEPARGEPVLAPREVPQGPWDVVVGAGPPARVRALGRHGGVRAVVVACTAADLGPRGWLQRMAWDAIPEIVLIDEADGGAAREGRHGIALESFALWPPAEPPREPIESADTDVLERACERAYARGLGPALRAGFLADRDGTLIPEHGYLDDPAQVTLLPGVAAALREVRAGGHPVAVISNQAGVGRGRFPLARAHEVMAALRHALRREGVELDAVRFCPHAPGEGCRCRKPGTLLIERVVQDLQLFPAHSVMAGDKRIDVAAGQAAGMLGLLVRTGYGGEEEGGASAQPDGVFGDLAAAVRWFLAREEARVIG